MRLQQDGSEVLAGPVLEARRIPPPPNGSTYWEFDKATHPIAARKARNGMVPPPAQRSFPMRAPLGVDRRVAECSGMLLMPVPSVQGILAAVGQGKFLDPWALLAEVVPGFEENGRAGSIRYREARFPHGDTSKRSYRRDNRNMLMPYTHRQRIKAKLSRKQLNKLRAGYRADNRRTFYAVVLIVPDPAHPGARVEWEPAPEFPLFDPSTSLLVEDSSQHCADLKSRRRWFKTKENALLYSALAFLLNRQQGHFHHPWVRDLLTVNDRWGPRMVLQGEKTEYCGYQVWLLNHRKNEMPLVWCWRFLLTPMMRN